MKKVIIANWLFIAWVLFVACVWYGLGWTNGAESMASVAIPAGMFQIRFYQILHGKE